MRSLITLTTSVLLALGIAAGAGTVANVREAKSAGPALPTPVVVDTDMSTDDVLALLYLLQRPDLDVRAVTVSGTGLAHCPAGARNALELLALTGHGDVPVACGRPTPLSGFNQFPAPWRAAADAFFGLELPPALRDVDHGSAVDLLRAVVQSSARKVTLLSLAPLTDTAELLDDPLVKTKLEALFVMGGAVGVPGNGGPGHENVEFNLWVDPAAAQKVLSSGLPITLVPLDATNDVPVTIYLATALQRYHYASRAGTAAWDLFASTGMFSGGQYFWDPLAAVALADPSALVFTQERLRVVMAPLGTAAARSNGRTIRTSDGAEVRVAVRANRQAFEHAFLDTLLGGTAFIIPPARAGATITHDGRHHSYVGPRRGPSGEVVFDTVNRGGRTSSFVVGRLIKRKTVADLRPYLRDYHGTPSWFVPEMRGETPPRSRMTWVAYLAPGRTVLICSTAGSKAAAALGPITVVRGR